ncbi:MAG: hypothetical protein R2932_50125 [Caldilineaceae bacterium]
MNNLIQKGGRWLVLLGVMAIFAACQPITPMARSPTHLHQRR